MSRFKIGDVVAWSSQGAGTWKEKTGVIVEEFLFRGAPRYRVEVKSEMKRGIPKIYTPWVSSLRKLR